MHHPLIRGRANKGLLTGNGFFTWRHVVHIPMCNRVKRKSCIFILDQLVTSVLCVIESVRIWQYHSDLYTTHAKSIISIMAKCENVLMQSPWIGITWIYQSIQSCNTYEPSQSTQQNNSKWFNGINQLNILLTFFGKSLRYRWPFLESLWFRWPFQHFWNQLY